MAGSADELLWRETYFILFPQERRPKLDQVASAITLGTGGSAGREGPTEDCLSRFWSNRPKTTPPWKSATRLAIR